MDKSQFQAIRRTARILAHSADDLPESRDAEIALRAQPSAVLRAINSTLFPDPPREPSRWERYINPIHHRTRTPSRSLRIGVRKINETDESRLH